MHALSLVVGLDTVTDPSPQTPFSMEFKRKKKVFFLNVTYLSEWFPPVSMDVLSVSNSL